MISSPEENFKKLQTLVSHIDDPRLLDLINYLGSNRGYQGFLNLVYAPASRSHHHDWLGGLVDHILEMNRIYECLPIPNINRDSIIRTIVLHDIHKGDLEYSVRKGTRLFEKNTKNHPIITNISLINRFNIKPSYEELEAIMASEGGYSQIKVSKQSTLTKLIYCLDELSANVYNGDYPL